MGSLLLEGLAVGALVHRGIGLVGAHQNSVQGAVVLVLAVVSALLDGAFDTFVGMTIHRGSSFDTISSHNRKQTPTCGVRK